MDFLCKAQDCAVAIRQWILSKDGICILVRLTKSHTHPYQGLENLPSTPSLCTPAVRSHNRQSQDKPADTKTSQHAFSKGCKGPVGAQLIKGVIPLLSSHANTNH